jgi:outer membrane protein assembly factor BamD
MLALAACQHEFDPKMYPNTDQLYKIALREFDAQHWANATKAFELLTTSLATRDPHLPAAYFYLGASQEKSRDYILAAHSFAQVADRFPQDTLAALSMFRSGSAYARMWTKPELDASNGRSALNTFETLVQLFPESPMVPRANAEISRLDNMFALKDYATAHHYRKRHAYDSAIIYYRDVVRLHPTAPITRDAYLELYDSYRDIKYNDDAHDLCAGMLKNYPNDREVISRCGSASSAAASTPHM